ncbi:MAG: serine hydrolase domain-containing protein [Ilumatobacteraceae bacterium]
MGVEGKCDDRFIAVREAFEANFERGEDIGASVAVTVEGELIVDLWGGTTGTDEVEDPEANVWQRDTIINTWSTTKTMTALCCLMLADAGELDLEATVASVWPEFAANDKRNVLISHVMSHSAGLPGWDSPMTTADLFDWEKATAALAEQAAWWEPGTVSGYHAVTQGYLLGEVVRRVTGQTIGQFFAAEVAAPLAADFHIGTPAEHDARAAHVIAPSGTFGADLDPGSTTIRALGNPALDATVANTIEWRRAEIPAAGGFGNARSVATVHAVIACGGEANGVRLLSTAGCDRIFDEQIYDQDLILPTVVRLGMGFGLVSPELPVGPNPRTCFWGGWGGSLAVIDLDAKMSFAYVMNRMGDGTLGDLRAAGPLLAVHATVTP